MKGYICEISPAFSLNAAQLQSSSKDPFQVNYGM